MADYTDFLDAPDDGRHDSFLEGNSLTGKEMLYYPTKSEGKGHKFKQFNPEESLVARIFGKYAPDVLDVISGATSTLKGTTNLVHPGSVTDTGIASSAGLPYNPDKESGAYIAGQVVDPAAAWLGYGAGKAVQAIPAASNAYKAAQTAKVSPITTEGVLRSGVAAGAGGSGAGYLSSEGNADQTATTGLFSAGLGMAAPFVGKAVSKGWGWLSDAVSGKLGQTKAGEIARAAAGGNLEEIRKAMKNAPADLTAGQAAYGIDQDMWQALQKLAKENDPSSYYRIAAERQASSREALLRSVTPDVEAATNARNAYAASAYPAEFTADRARRAAAEASINPTREFVLTNPSTGSGYYKLGTPAQVPLSPKLSIIADNTMFKDAAKAAGRAIVDDIRIDPKLASEMGAAPEKSLQGLQAIKTTIDEAIKDPSKVEGLSKYSNSSLKELRKRLLDAMSEIGAYDKVRQEFAAKSVPINQGKVLEELTSVLTSPNNVGERSVPFLNAMGRGEGTALNKAGLDARYGGIQDVLSPKQNAAVAKVSGELVRDARMEDQAKAGMKAMQDVVEQFRVGFRIPQQLNPTITFTNKMLQFIEEKMNANAKQALIEGMKNGKSAAEMLDALPNSERNKLLLFLNQTSQKASAIGTAAGVYGAAATEK